MATQPSSWKKEPISAVNILTLWQQTLDDLVSFGAKIYNPSLKVHGAPLHMGTREIQLTFLKSCLLLGVQIEYKYEMIGILKPIEGKWKAVCRPYEKLAKTEDALSFKPLKSGDYQATFACNMVESPQVNPSFFYQASADIPDEAVVREFNALILAEGEWSQTTRFLGFEKTVDKFKQAI